MTATSTLSVPLFTANDRLKSRANGLYWAAVATAALLHFLVLAFWPQMTAADYTVDGTELEQIEVPPQIEIPPPPEELVRPSVPLLSTDIELSTDLTITPNVFSEHPPATLPPPPAGRVELSAEPRWTPFEVRPELTNREAYAQALARRYPGTLRDAGIGGTAVIWVYIDESGAVQDSRVNVTSGYTQFDEVALTVLKEVAHFTPALNRDQAVPVWIQLNVTFEPRDR